MIHSAAGLGPEVAGAPAGSVELARVEEVVRRIAWGGDRRRGVARIELGGELAGTAIIVRGEGREVSLEVERGRGDVGPLAERIAERLSERGLTVRSLEVR